MKRLALLLLALLAFAAPAFSADTTTASCEESDVQSTINAATAGDTIRIKAGSCTWTSQVTVNKAIHLRGEVDCTVATEHSIANIPQSCTTEIIDNITKDPPSSGAPALAISGINGTAVFELSNFAFTGMSLDSNIWNQGHITITGTTTQLKIHTLIFTNQQTTAFMIDGPTGVIHHIKTDGNFYFLQHRLTTYGSSDYGDGSFITAIDWGGPFAMYVEDSIFAYRTDTSGQVPGLSDCTRGGRVVWRKNYISGNIMGSHGTDSGNRERGCLQEEYYDNTFVFGALQTADFIMWIRGGTGLAIRNTVTGIGALNMVIKALNCRDVGSGCTGPWIPWDTGTTNGYCDGTGTYDGNVMGQTGYRCVDQPGSGTSADLGGTATPATSPVANVIEPIYQAANTSDLAPTFGMTTGSTHVIADRDYFMQASGIQTTSSSPFDGTSGMGWGTIARRPATCTYDETYGAGVAYWATDEGEWDFSNGATVDGKMYICTADNTWTARWGSKSGSNSGVPYTYPHPLTNSMSISPTSGTQGNVNLAIDATGTGTTWANGTSAATFSGTGITVNSTTCSSATACSVSITIAADATVSARTMTITTNADTDTATFTVNSAPQNTPSPAPNNGTGRGRGRGRGLGTRSR